MLAREQLTLGLIAKLRTEWERRGGIPRLVTDNVAEIESRMDADEMGEYYNTAQWEYDCAYLCRELSDFAPKGWYYGRALSGANEYGFFPAR